MRVIGMVKTALIGLAMIAGGQAMAAGKLYEVISFGAPIAGTERLHAEDNGRADLGNDVSYKEVDEAGLAALPNPPGTTRMVYEVMAPPIATRRDATAEAATLAKGSGEPALHYLFAQLSPGPGHEAEFNAFYDSTHLPDVLNVPGMIWGLRARLVSASPGAKAPAYLALYQFRSFNLRATIDEVNRRLKEQITRPFPKGAVGPPAFAFYAVPVADH